MSSFCTIGLVYFLSLRLVFVKSYLNIDHSSMSTMIEMKNVKLKQRKLNRKLIECQIHEENKNLRLCEYLSV